MSDLKADALDLYKPPFKFIHGYIQDSDGRIVADDDGVSTAIVGRVRGWGRIKYLPDPEALQDKVGEIIAEAITEYWERQAQPAAPQVGGAMVQRALDAKVAEGETVFWSIVFGLNKDSESTRAIMAKEIIRTALKAALSQPGEGE